MIDLYKQPNFEDIEAIRGGHLITEARLFEEKHIVREFDECINDITNHIKLFKTNKDDMIGNIAVGITILKNTSVGEYITQNYIILFLLLTNRLPKKVSMVLQLNVMLKEKAKMN